MKTSASGRLRRLYTIMAAGALVTAATGATGAFGATSAFAAKPQHRPHHRSKLTGDEVVRRAMTDLDAATSVRLYSRDSSLGLTTTQTETYAEQGCLASFSITGEGANISENILVIGTSGWIQPSNGFWQALGYTGTELASLEGKWLTLAAFENLFGVTGLPSTASCSIHSIHGILPPSGWTLDRSVKVSGRWAWRVTSKSLKVTICAETKGKCQSSALTADISDTGKPELLSLTLFGLTDYFSHYNAPVTLTPPPAADVLTSVPPPPNGFTADIRSLPRTSPLAQLVSATRSALTAPLPH
jgi:hypothetical protein